MNLFSDYHRRTFLIGLVVSIISCLLTLNREASSQSIEEPSMEQFDNYLSDYIGNSEKIALLLDYDGTLAKICPHPNDTTMTPETEQSLRNIGKNSKIFTAVISGRGVDNVKEKVAIDGLVYAGNHGLEILYNNGTRYIHNTGEVSQNYSKMVDALWQIVRDGAWIEDKKFSLTFHYRAVCEDQHSTIRQEAIDIIKSFGYKANQAHCAIEAKPPVEWNKGKAADYILRHEFGDNWSSEVKTIFAGDDTTDEDVCELLTGVGVSFRVTADPNVSTKATHKVPSTESVTHLLQWIDRKFS